MKKVIKGIVNPLSRGDLKILIKRHGLQSWMFDEKLLFFRWDGLEYEFYIFEDRIYLEKITIHNDVFLANLESFNVNIAKAEPKVTDFLE